MTESQIPKLNEQNEIIGETTITEAVQNNWPRRIVRVFIFNKDGDILLQKRSDKVKSFPGLWDHAVGGHVDVGESPIEAAEREMKEEVGVVTPLTAIVEEYKPSTFPENMFNYVYQSILPAEAELKEDKHEVAELSWFTIEEFENNITNEPEQFVPALLHVWKEFRDKLIP